MKSSFLDFSRVAYSYPESPVALFENLSVSFPEGWSAVIGANGTGKTTLLRLAAGALAPDSGTVRASGRVLLIPQECDSFPPELVPFLESLDGRAASLADEFGLADPDLTRFDSLSEGWKRRYILAAALWSDPSVLLVDEPTNHLDAEAKDVLLTLLRRFQGIGLIVSHDRAFVDALCGRCLFLEPGRAVLRPGNYTEGRQQERLERESAWSARQEAERRIEALEKEVVRRRQEAAKKATGFSKAKLDRHDGDGRFRINRARVTSKDAVAVRAAGRMERTVAREKNKLDGTPVAGRRKSGVTLRGSAFHGDFFVRIQEGTYPAWPDCVFELEPLSLAPVDRVALTGPNGSGKTALLERILLPRLRERFGEPSIGGTWLWIPQVVGDAEFDSFYRDFSDLDRIDRGRVLAFVERLGSEAEPFLSGSASGLSPGERRKLVLAAGLSAGKNLLVLDEPTNHFDVVAVEGLQTALGDADVSLLLVSHDAAFRRAVASVEWRIETGKDGKRRLTKRNDSTASIKGPSNGKQQSSGY